MNYTPVADRQKADAAAGNTGGAPLYIPVSQRAPTQQPVQEKKTGIFDSIKSFFGIAPKKVPEIPTAQQAIYIPVKDRGKITQPAEPAPEVFKAPIQPPRQEFIGPATKPSKFDEIYGKIREFILDPTGTRATTQKAQDINDYVIAKHPELAPNLHGIDKITNQIDQMSFPEKVLSVGVLTGFLSAPAITAISLAEFLAIDAAVKKAASLISKKKIENFSDILPDNMPQYTKDVFDIVTFIGEGFAVHGINKKAPQVVENITKNITEQYNMPRSVYIEPAKIRDIFQTGTKISPEELKLVQELGLDAEGYKQAFQTGTRIEVPIEKLTTVTDKPYWAKLKQIIRLTPTEPVTTVSRPAKPTRGPAGLLEAGKEAPPEVKPVYTPVAERQTPAISAGATIAPPEARLPIPRPEAPPEAILEHKVGDIVEVVGKKTGKTQVVGKVLTVRPDGLIIKEKQFGLPVLFNKEAFEFKKTGAGVVDVLKQEAEETATRGIKEFEDSLKKVAERTGEKMTPTILSLDKIKPIQIKPDLELDAPIKAEIQQGKKYPLIVEFRDGIYHLVDGHHRYKAYQELGIEDVPVMVNESGVERFMPDKQEITKLEKDLNDKIQSTGKEKVKEELTNIMAELEISQPGERIFVPSEIGGGSDVIGVPSTFPNWIPEDLRSTNLFKKVLGGIRPDAIVFPQGNRARQRALYNAILKELDRRLGIDTEPIRTNIINTYGGKQKTRIEESAGGGVAGGERAGEARTGEIDVEKAFAKRAPTVEEARRAFGGREREGFKITEITSEEIFAEKPRGIKGAAIGEFADTPVEVGHLNEIKPIELPELVDLAREVSSVPGVVRFPRFPTGNVIVEGGVARAEVAPKKLGQHQAGTIKLDISLFKPENIRQLAKVFAHEIGHLVDWLPDKISHRGNVLGRLFTLRKFLKSTYGSEGALDLKKLRNEATKEILKETGHTFGEMVSGKLPTEIKTQIKERVNQKIFEAGAVRKAEIFDELYALSKYWRPFDEATANASLLNYRKSSSELYADAVSALFNSPGTVERIAPKFYESFFENLDRKPEVREAYFDLQSLYSGDRSVLLKHRREGVQEMFKEGDFKAKELQQQKTAERQKRLSDIVFRLKFDFVTKNAALEQRINELEKKGTYINPDDNPVLYLRESNYLGGKIFAWMKTGIQPVYTDLQNAGISWEEFGEALFYDRVINDRSGFANPRGITPEAAKELLADMKTQLGEAGWSVLQNNIIKFRAALREPLEAAYQNGLYSTELYEQMRENPAYVTFRVLDHLEENVNSKVYKQIGTLKDIQNPADASILKTISTIRATERELVKSKLIKLFNDYFPGQIEDARTMFTGKTHIALEPKNPDQRLIIKWERGKAKGYYVDEYVAASMERNTIVQNNVVISGIRFMNAGYLRPIFITFNLGFQSFNLVRDFVRFWKNVPGATIWGALGQYKKAVLPAKIRAFGLPKKPTAADIEADKLITQMYEDKILSVTFNDLSRGLEVEDKQIEEILKKSGIDSLTKTPEQMAWWKQYVMKPLDFIEKLGNMIETLPKVAGLFELQSQGKIKDMAMKDFIRRNIGSPDFLDGGYLKPVTNEIFLFSNAITQGIRSDLEIMTNPKTRGGWWWKTAQINIVPKILMFAAGLGLFGASVKKMMEDASEYDKTNYTIVPLGTDSDTKKTAYMRIPQDETGRLIGGIVWKALNSTTNRQNILTDLAQILSFTGGQIPQVTPPINALTDTAQFLTGRNPYDAFRGRTVIPDEEFRAGGVYALKSFLKYEFDQLGGGIFYRVNIQKTPTPKSGTEKVLDLPILNNVLGRWLRVSNYGQLEKLRQEVQEITKSRAGEMVEERDIVNKHLKEWQADPNKALRVRFYENKIIEEVLGHPTPRNKEEADKKSTLISRFKLARLKGGDDPKISALITLQTNEEKTKLLQLFKDTMAKEEWEDFKGTLRQEKIINTELLGKLK